MGRRGPKPRPKELSKILGNPGKRAKSELNDGPEFSKPTTLKPPTFLDKVGKQEWNRVAPELAEFGLLTNSDQMALAIYCQAVSEFVAADAVIKKKGPDYTSDKGNILPRPQVAMRRSAAMRILKACQEFGMTPSARSRMVVNVKGKQKDKPKSLNEIMEGK